MALQEPIMGKTGLHGVWMLGDRTFAVNSYTVWTSKYLRSALSGDAASLRGCLCCVFKYFCFRSFIFYVLFSNEFSEGWCNPHEDTEVLTLLLSFRREREREKLQQK
jgi:hypothetical protein